MPIYGRVHKIWQFLAHNLTEYQYFLNETNFKWKLKGKPKLHFLY